MYLLRTDNSIIIKKKIKSFVYITIFAMILFSSCDSKDEEIVDYRAEMRNFVINLSIYSKDLNNSFIIIPQNGQELMTDNGEGDGIVYSDYLSAIDATGREDIFFGYDDDNIATPEEDKQHLLNLCLLCEQNDIEVIATDYCYTHSYMDSSYLFNNRNGFISFAASDRNLRVIPDYPSPIFNENTLDIDNISMAQNVLYLINSENYISKQDFIDDVSTTNYDLIIMDLYHNELSFTEDEVRQLKYKHNGGRRLVVCYMSIGEAEDYRFYWKDSWAKDRPDWLEKENPEWEGNYKVKYWKTNWQDIIFGNEDSYLKKIINANFDGVYLDIIDGFEYFEE